MGLEGWLKESQQLLPWQVESYKDLKSVGEYASSNHVPTWSASALQVVQLLCVNIVCF